MIKKIGMFVMLMLVNSYSSADVLSNDETILCCDDDNCINCYELLPQNKDEDDNGFDEEI